MQKDRPELLLEHAEKRLEWAETYAGYTPTDWWLVIWSDECSVERGDGVRPIWTWNPPPEQIPKRDVHPVRTGKGVK